MRPAILLATILVPSLSFAWNGDDVTAPGLRVIIAPVPDVTALDTPAPVSVRLRNLSGQVLEGTLRIADLVDATRIEGPDQQPFSLTVGGEADLEFQIAFGPGTESALYPVHAYADYTLAGAPETAHAVRIVTTKLPAAPRATPESGDLRLNKVPDHGALPLAALNTQQVSWAYYDQPARSNPPGWVGTDEVSSATFSVGTPSRPDTRTALTMHPPWRPAGGTVFADYLLQLPQTTPLTLTFAVALRDNFPPEPPSDGVQFRVWVVPPGRPDRADLMYETLTATKRWEPAEVDLSAYAGQRVILRLESDPGPKRDTTCDQCYWAEPTVTAGEIPPDSATTLADRAAENTRLGRRLLAGTLAPDDKFTFVLGEGDARMAAVLEWTPRGVLEGALTLVGPGGAVTFDGLRVKVLGQEATRWPTSLEFRGYESHFADGRWTHIHHLAVEGRPFDLNLTVWAEGAALRLACQSTERITDIALGPADRTAPVLYYGHGYRVVNPTTFATWFGGHDLATSHVAFEFQDGPAVLQAVDNPPDILDINPEARRYSLHTHMNATMTLLPGEKGAFDCALRYRPLYDKKPAGAVERLAGRYCFDIWGGSYRSIADNMALMFRYGLTDAILTIHDWQRWGYDYRLPDIWPPNPDKGSLDDLRALAAVCAERDVPWGLHDNYIDFYPDAAGYTYDAICYNEFGSPIGAWYNEGREAQSYRWRPDAFEPFLKRNLALMKEGVAPTASFVDVFTSIGCFDYYDRQGNFHPATETRQKFGECFATIRDTFGNAPTTSEAGHDGLIGYLDGADCQHMPFNPKCASWEKVPWFDAVNHARFIQHGVGYSSRYESGRSREAHGINSDDYISCELLEGHALMTDAGCWGAPAVRKYWLAQNVARDLALKDIISVELAGGNAERQIVSWSNGTRVYVNRGPEDWAVEGHTLPQYGYLALGGADAPQLTSTIETRDGVFCESSTAPGEWYCNGRGFDGEPVTRIEPSVEKFEYLGNNQIRWDMVWRAEDPAPRNMRVFVHFYTERSTRADKIGIQDDHDPQVPPTQWSGTVRYSRTVTLPPDADGDYVATAGFYDDQGRLNILGRTSPAGGNAMLLGKLTVRRENGRIADVRFTYPEPEPEAATRWNKARKPVDFGFALTSGGLRIQRTPAGLTVTPLPRHPDFDMALRLDRLGHAGDIVSAVTAVAPDGTRRPVIFTQAGDRLELTHQHGVFCYEVAFQPSAAPQ